MNNLLDFWTDETSEPIIETKPELPLEFQKCKQFGVPYMGSKNKIVKKLIEQLPSAKYFIDLFAGGCAMTHGAMLSGKYERFIANDISDAPSLFLDAINGKFKNETRWISRDDFFALKDKEPYVRYCWSFGNNGKGYMYSREIEPYKKAFWEFAVFKNAEPLRAYGFNIDELLDLPTSYERRIVFRQYLAKLPFIDKKGSHFYYKPSEIKKYKGFDNNTMLDALQSLQRLESLQNLENLENFENLEIHQKSYNEVELPNSNDCIIYLDPPYKDTVSYLSGSFNHDEFYDWCIEKAKQGYKIFISEYDMPSDRFKSIFNVAKRQQLHHLGAGKLKQEHLFIPII